MLTDIQIMKRKDKNNQKSLATTLLELILINFNDYEKFGRKSAYIAESIKKQTKKQTKMPLIDDLSKRLLELEFKQHNATKSKCLKWIVKNILPNYKK